MLKWENMKTIPELEQIQTLYKFGNVHNLSKEQKRSVLCFVDMKWKLSFVGLYFLYYDFVGNTP